MKQLQSTNKKRQGGFTLIEIMVVIVILGILGSIVVPAVFSQKDKADIQKAVSDISALENAVTMYKFDNYQFPSTEQGLEALVSQTDIEPLPRRFPSGGYLKRLQKDPWGNDYQLLNPGEQSDMDIFSMGPDGEAGTDDDIGNWNLTDYQ